MIRSYDSFAKEILYVHAGYRISVGSIRLVLATPFGACSEQISNAVHGMVGEVTSKSGVVLQTYSPMVVPYLTDDDREEIKRGDGILTFQKIY